MCESKKCVWCEKPLTGKQKKFCSKICISKYYNNKRDTKPKIYGNCENCGIKLKEKRRKFCSKICISKYHNNKRYPDREEYENCLSCGKILLGKRWKYCSSQCNGKYRRKIKKESIKNKNCKWCNTPFIPVRSLQKYCSKECSWKYWNNEGIKSRGIKKYKDCIICGTKLKKGQKKYCSRKCRSKNYKTTHKKEIKKSSKIYRENHKEQIRKSSKIYYENNKEKLNKQARKWNIENKEKIREKVNKRANKKYKEDPIFRLNSNIRSAISMSLKSNNLSKNGRHWEDLVGYTIYELKEHLEKQFLPGMNWENKGKWHIHHIIPIAFFKFTSTDDVEFKICWSLENLCPLWEKKNKEKNDKIILWGKEIRATDIDKYTNAI